MEAEVWTERMLTTLETGVKGGKNAYFIEQGLFTMAVAHAQICQSRRGPHLESRMRENRTEAQTNELSLPLSLETSRDGEV